MIMFLFAALLGLLVGIAMIFIFGYARDLRIDQIGVMVATSVVFVIGMALALAILGAK